MAAPLAILEACVTGWLFFQFFEGRFVVCDFVFEAVFFAELQQLLHALDWIYTRRVDRFCVALAAQV